MREESARVQIRNRYDRDHVIWTAPPGVTSLIRADLRGADLGRADLEGADLSGADLSGASLPHAWLKGADLAGADLREANLRCACLRRADLAGADLAGADLAGADLREANLRYADLAGADLAGADLRGAYFRCADLRGARLQWNSHDLIAEILLSHAGSDIARRSLAGLVLVSRDWCWRQWEQLDHPEREWALGVLRQYVIDGVGVPELLR